MRKPIEYLKIMIAATAIFSLGFSDVQSRWDRISGGLRETDVKKVVITPDQNGLWVVAGRSMYRGQLSSNRYTFSSISPQISSTINDILDADGAIYLATDDGLYTRSVSDYHFKRIFSSSDELQRQCLSVSLMDGRLFVGTRKGLFYKDVESSSWQTLRGELAQVSITRLVPYAGMMYVLNSKSLFRVDPSNQTHEEIFTLGLSSEKELEEKSEAANSGVDDEMVDFRPVDAHAFYLGTKKGIYISRDSGTTWQSMANEGLPYGYLRRLLVVRIDSKDELIAATAQGIYYFDGIRWAQMYQGLESNDIADLAQDDRGHIFAATQRGLFRLVIASPQGEAIAKLGGCDSCLPAGRTSVASSSLAMTPQITFKDYSEIERYFAFEPSIADVQAMAIHYAEVHPDKIKSWRKRAQMQAFMPNVSAGLDRSATDKFHWDSGANPDSLLKGREYLDWDVGLSWNLGELVWNNDQTSIDSRSKLMVELREDVIDQVTRIYFERRRTQIEVITSTSSEAKDKIEQQMRLAELTAILDGFTGGKFSRSIAKMEDRG